MTIALGILASDALIVAADRQVGISDATALKVGKFKIAYATAMNSDGVRPYCLAVTGSGTLSHVRRLHQDFLKLIDKDNPPSMDAFDAASEAHIIDFHGRHIQPLAGRRGSPYFNLLYAYQSPDGQGKLWTTNAGNTTESTTFAAVGIGQMYAEILLNRLFFPMYPLDYRVAALLAIYIIHEVNENIEGCGKKTLTVHRRQAVDRAAEAYAHDDAIIVLL